MSRELEIMKEERERLVQEDYADSCIEECDLVIKALQRLESIDNANPSEALECLDKLAKQIELDEDTDFWEIRNAHKTVEQALLKAQEQKHYLKWEDLKFTTKEQTINVLLNGEKYFVKYRLGYLFGYYETVEITTKGCVLCTLGNLMIQFFNDLHLEKVEE